MSTFLRIGFFYKILMALVSITFQAWSLNSENVVYAFRDWLVSNSHW